MVQKSTNEVDLGKLYQRRCSEPMLSNVGRDVMYLDRCMERDWIRFPDYVAAMGLPFYETLDAVTQAGDSLGSGSLFAWLSR